MKKLLSFALMAALAIGCGQKASPADEQARAEAIERGPALHEHVLDRVLKNETLALRADQRATLEALKASLQPGEAAVKRELSALGLLLASSLDANSFDAVAVHAQLVKVREAELAMQPALTAAIVKVHDVLSADQRAALVKSFAGHGGKHGSMALAYAGSSPAMLEGLDLTDGQKETLKASMHEGKKGKKSLPHEGHLSALKTAFLADELDAKSVPDLARASKLAERSARFVEAAIPVLDSSQRAKLADKIRARVTSA